LGVLLALLPLMACEKEPPGVVILDVFLGSFWDVSGSLGRIRIKWEMEKVFTN